MRTAQSVAKDEKRPECLQYRAYVDKKRMSSLISDHFCIVINRRCLKILKALHRIFVMFVYLNKQKMNSHKTCTCFQCERKLTHTRLASLRIFVSFILISSSLLLILEQISIGDPFSTLCKYLKWCRDDNNHYFFIDLLNTMPITYQSFL